MKNLTLFGALLILSTINPSYAIAQRDDSKEIAKKIAGLRIVDHLDKVDRNDILRNDQAFSNCRVATITNENKFIKSDIGADSIDFITPLDGVDDFPLVIRDINEIGDSLVVNTCPSDSTPLIINGFRYTSIHRVTTKDRPQYLSISKICSRHTNYPMSKVIVSINGLTLLKDITSYKIAERYIQRVDCVKTTDIEGFTGDFVLIKIYTKTPMNLQRNVMRLGKD